MIRRCQAGFQNQVGSEKFNRLVVIDWQVPLTVDADEWLAG
jgi:hypothetical protein